MSRSPRWEIVDFEDIPGTPCPCGVARRAFADNEYAPGTVHLTEISEDAERHFHRNQTETYFILECEPDACIELDNERIPIRPRMAILIPPGVRHRAIGRMTILNIVVPKFDPNDEHIDGQPVH